MLVIVALSLTMEAEVLVLAGLSKGALKVDVVEATYDTALLVAKEAADAVLGIAVFKEESAGGAEIVARTQST